MREVHIRQPLWLGDRKEMHVGIAHYRLVDKFNRPYKGNIKVWIDYKVHDKNSPDPNAMVLMYRMPFVIKCTEAVTCKTQTLLDYNRTILHIVPLASMKIHKENRTRCQPQDEFKALLSKSELTDKESMRMASLAKQIDDEAIARKNETHFESLQ